MDFWFVAAVSALLLFSVDSEETSEVVNATTTNSPITFRTELKPQPCPTSGPSRPVLHLLKVQWGPKCEGEVISSQPFLNTETNFFRAVCYSSKAKVKALLKDVCEEKNGCGRKTKFESSENESDGFEISENGGNKTCETLRIRCHGSVPVAAEERPLVESCDAVGYKVATALLCIVLISLFLLRFTRPTVKALQKRLSNKRQNRWIGPTQSHSVSYHRGQAVNKTMDGEKHSSYPALDRLVVGNREPSSNRNSYNV